jgi:hypothetical protein
MVTLVLLAWAEFPLSTSAIFLIPRVLQRQWRRVNKALSIIDMVPAHHVYPLDLFESEIPLMLLYLPAHIRLLSSPSDPSTRLDRSALPSDWRLHDEQADFLRGL